VDVNKKLYLSNKIVILLVVLTNFIFFNPALAVEDYSYLENKVSRPDYSIVEKLIVNYAVVGFSWVDLPLNKLLLIKAGNAQCAIKYNSYWKGHDKKEASIFSSGEESLYAKAEFVRLRKGDFSKVKKFEFSKIAPTGIGKVAYDSSNDIIKCGDERLLWQYPTALVALSLSSNIYMAISELENFDLVSFDDPELSWHSFESERTIKILKMNQKIK